MNGDILFFFFNDTATTEIYTLSLHDALPISRCGADIALQFPHVALLQAQAQHVVAAHDARQQVVEIMGDAASERSEEHTSELQSRQYLVCRLLLEKKKKTYNISCYFSTLTPI